MTEHSCAGADWLEVQNVKLSPLGRRVADLLGDLYAGIYHLERAVRRVDWANEYYIEISVPDSIATFDGGVLTWLVFLCHDRCLRCEMCSSRPGHLKLRFHGRQRTGHYCKRHPTLEAAVKEFRSTYPDLEDCYTCGCPVVRGEGDGHESPTISVCPVHSNPVRVRGA